MSSEVDKLKHKILLLVGVVVLLLILTLRLLVLLNDVNINYTNRTFVSQGTKITINFDTNAFYVNKLGYGSLTGYNIAHNNIVIVVASKVDLSKQCTSNKDARVAFYTNIAGNNIASCVNEPKTSILTDFPVNGSWYVVEVSSANQKSSVDKQTVQRILTTFEAQS